jgi:hypothetical protein
MARVHEVIEETLPDLVCLHFGDVLAVIWGFAATCDYSTALQYRSA